MRLVAAAILALALVVPAWGADDPPPRPALLIVGTPHFANHGRDIVNIEVADVLSPDRQDEIDAIVERLAAFRPNHVAIEWPADRQDELDARYRNYREGRLTLSADETDQIGLRLAARLGLDRVAAVDWNEAPPGEMADYDFLTWLKNHGQSERWQARSDRRKAEADADAALMLCTPVSSWIRTFSSPTWRRQSHRAYYEIAQFGDPAGADPGATWVGNWYARNLRILKNIRALAPEPADRVVVIYGAGHAYLIDQMARESRYFDVADTLDWLPASPRDGWTHCPG